MDREAFRKAMVEIGRKGGLARAKKMTPKQRSDSALKASKAAAAVRKKAKEKKNKK
jgi:hypothetical protein